MKKYSVPPRNPQTHVPIIDGVLLFMISLAMITVMYLVIRDIINPWATTNGW